jgi:hypothetical protein
MFQRFLDATDYWFGYSDNSSAGSYDPARECFVVLANDQANVANVVEAGDGEIPPGPGTRSHQGAGRSAPPPSPPRGADINAQLAQARELEPKLAEEYRAVRLLRASIAREASARGERARELGKQTRERINIDFDVDNPNTPSRVSQKLIATATLLRAMSNGPPWAHYLGGYQDRLLGAPLGLPDLCRTLPNGVRRKDYGGEVLG